MTHLGKGNIGYWPWLGNTLHGSVDFTLCIPFQYPLLLQILCRFINPPASVSPTSLWLVIAGVLQRSDQVAQCDLLPRALKKQQARDMYQR